MHYFGENMHKTKVFLHKSEKYAKPVSYTHKRANETNSLI